jgi:hypothetical protein
VGDEVALSLLRHPDARGLISDVAPDGKAVVMCLHCGELLAVEESNLAMRIRAGRVTFIQHQRREDQNMTMLAVRPVELTEPHHTGQRSPRELISATLFATLTMRLAEDEKWELTHAERVMEQALIFLKAIADNPGLAMSPTIAVDPGWHTFLLHAEEYADFCARIAGRFIHHRPICNDDIVSGTALSRSLTAMEATGYALDTELWTVAANCNTTKCHQCHATCHDSN